MSKSSHRPTPGDSVPRKPDRKGIPETADDSPLKAELPELSIDPALRADDSPHAEEDEGHVFFDTDDPLSNDPDALSGDTVALDAHDVARLSSGMPQDVSDSGVLDSSTYDETSEGAGTASDEGGLTDVGLPSFEMLEDAPGNEGTHAPPATTNEHGQLTESTTADDFTMTDGPTFPGSDDVHVDEVGPSFPSPSDVLDNSDVPAFPSPSDVHDSSVAPRFPSADSANLEPPTSVNPQAATSESQSHHLANEMETAPSAAVTRPPQDAPGQAAAGHQGRQRLLVILLASYASAVTCALVWLWINQNGVRPHELESLPDVAPLKENEFRYALQSATMPTGHTLPLGSRQQLGYIRVEPLRVTRGPVEFVHYAAAAATKPPTGPVLKLWLRFTNVSDDQLIAPLDSKLLFAREYDDVGDPSIANQIVFPAESKRTGGGMVFLLEHPQTSEWDLKGQQLGHRLKPGESIETYIPTRPEGIAHLTGELLWRVHFRKGYNAESGHGVTTMIEVPFTAGDIRNEVAS